MSFWDNLQSKSSETKAQFAFFCALIVTGIVGTIWLSTIPSRFAEVGKPPLATTEEETSENNLMDIFDATKEQVGTIAESVDDIKNSLTEETIVEVSQPDTNTEGALNTMQITEQSTSTPGETISLHDVLPQPDTTTQKIEMNSTTSSSTPPPQPRVIRIGTTTVSQ